ncbi:MAG: hypothetical protein ACXADB_14690, partial [Candidatus Hermodarchaeia archaeon]
IFSGSWFVLALFFIFSVLFVVNKWAVYNLDAIGTYFDTTSYAMVADVPLLDKRFWLRERPFTVPLIYKLLGAKGELYLIPSEVFQKITQFQFYLSILSWVILGASLSCVTNTKWVKVSVYAIILFFGGAIDLSQWDRILISESISLSFFALLLAMVVLGTQFWDKLWATKTLVLGVTLALFISVASLYAFSRDVNAYFIFMMTIALAGYVLLRSRSNKTHRKSLFVVFILLIVFLAQALSSSVGHRWFGPFRNVFYARILPSDQALEHFLDAGLPLDAGDVAQFRRYEREQFMENFNSPKYEAAQDWIMDNGRSVYAAYLLKDPIRSFLAPLKELFYPRLSLFMTLLAIVGVVLLIWISMRGGTQAWWGVPLLLLISAYPLMFIVFHGDAIELERHALQISMQIRLAGWMLLVALVDTIASKIKYSKVF